MNPEDIVILLVIGVLLFALINEALQIYKFNKYIVIAIIGIILIAAISYYSYQRIKTIPRETISEKEEKEVPDEKEQEVHDAFNPPSKYEEVETRISTGVNKDNTDVVDYEYFKKVILTEDFCRLYYKSVLENYRLKMQKYLAIRIQMENDYATASKNAPQHPQLREDTIGHLQVGIAECKEILAILSRKLKTSTYSSIKDSLHDAIYRGPHCLESLYGRKDVKDFISQRLYAFAHNPKIISSFFQNILLLGPPGFGKTTIANVFSYVYNCSGILVREKALIKTASDFTTGFVNTSGRKTEGLLYSSFESVLFIDEIYELSNSNTLLSSDHSGEAITMLVNFIDKYIGTNIIIGCGYAEDVTRRFLGSNKGLDRRFPFVRHLDAYSSEELTKIAIRTIHDIDKNMTLTKNDTDVLFSYIVKMNDNGYLPNQAGDIKNVVGRILTSYNSMINKDFRKAMQSGMNEYLEKYKVHFD